MWNKEGGGDRLYTERAEIWGKMFLFAMREEKKRSRVVRTGCVVKGKNF